MTETTISCIIYRGQKVCFETTVSDDVAKLFGEKKPRKKIKKRMPNLSRWKRCNRI